MTPIIPTWVPLESIGPFLFNDEISRYISEYALSPLSEKCSITGWITYGRKGLDLQIHVENRHVTSIACYEECLYRVRNLIGMSFDEVCSFIGFSPNGEVDRIDLDEDDSQLVYEFDSLSLQVWVKGDTVVTVFCGPAYE